MEKKKYDIAIRIKTEVDRWNISPRHSATWWAVVVFFFMAETGLRHPAVIWSYVDPSGYPYLLKKDDVYRFIDRWIKAGYYDGRKFTIEMQENEIETLMEITLLGMVATGDIARIVITKSLTEAECKQKNYLRAI